MDFSDFLFLFVASCLLCIYVSLLYGDRIKIKRSNRKKHMIISPCAILSYQCIKMLSTTHKIVDSPKKASHYVYIKDEGIEYYLYITPR